MGSHWSYFLAFHESRNPEQTINIQEQPNEGFIIKLRGFNSKASQDVKASLKREQGTPQSNKYELKEGTLLKLLALKPTFRVTRGTLKRKCAPSSSKSSSQAMASQISLSDDEPNVE